MSLEYESMSHIRRLDYYEDFGAIGTIMMILFLILWISSCAVIIRRCLFRQRLMRELSQSNANPITIVSDGRVITLIPVNNNGEIVQGVPYQYPPNSQNPSNYYSPNQQQQQQGPYEEEPTYLNPTIAEMPAKQSDIVSVNP